MKMSKELKRHLEKEEIQQSYFKRFFGITYTERSH